MSDNKFLIIILASIVAIFFLGPLICAIHRRLRYDLFRKMCSWSELPQYQRDMLATACQVEKEYAERKEKASASVAEDAKPRKKKAITKKADTKKPRTKKSTETV